MNVCLGTYTGGVSPPQLAPCLKPPLWPISSHITSVKFKIFHQHDLLLWAAEAAKRQTAQRPRRPELQDRVLRRDSALSQTQQRQKSDLTVEMGSVTLRISDESSGLPTYWSLCWSLSSVCSFTISLVASHLSPGSDFFSPRCISLQVTRWVRLWVSNYRPPTWVWGHTSGWWEKAWLAVPASADECGGGLLSDTNDVRWLQIFFFIFYFIHAFSPL